MKITVPVAVIGAGRRDGLGILGHVRRTLKYRALVVALGPGNQVLKWQLRHGLAPRAFALLETIGRRSGKPRPVCVGNGLDGDTFWVIAAHGEQSDWVRNIRHDRRVRVLVDRRWRTGWAVVRPDDDVAERSRQLPVQWDAALGRAIATTPVVIRIDLIPQPGGMVSRR